MKKLILILFFIISFCTNSFSDVIISLSGDDTTGDGSISTPYKTIQKGIDALKIQGPGNTLFLRGGTYTEIPLGLAGGLETRRISFTSLNDATSWDNSYTIKSYPGEWAIVDAGEYTDARVYVFWGGDTTGGMGFVEFSNFEIRNAYGTTHCSAINTRGGPFKIKYMYIHDNNCGSYSNNPAGIQLTNGTGMTDIEYNVFYKNGYLLGEHENSANIVLYSDYIGTWGTQSLVNASGYSTARHSNNIRYNVIDGGGLTSIGIKHKSRQYLENNVIFEGPVEDVNGWFDKGGDTNHNIIINHSMHGIYSTNDFEQIHNNIFDGSQSSTYSVIQIGSTPTPGRQPSDTVFYNNTILNSNRGIVYPFHNEGYPVFYHRIYNYNNIIDSATDASGYRDVNFMLLYNESITWDIDNLCQFTNNMFYRYDNTSFFHVLTADISGYNVSPWAIDNFIDEYDAGDFLYKGVSGADRYKLNPSYSNYSGVSTGGLNKNHPYFPDTKIPQYIGAVNPLDDAWVDGLLSLDVQYMTSASGDPVWIESEPIEKNVYVSTIGSDNSGTGSFVNPYKTIQKGIDALKIKGPGNTLFLRGGVYTEIPIGSAGGNEARIISFTTLNNATSWDNSYTIKSYPGEWAIVDAGEYTDNRVFIFWGGDISGGLGFIEFSNFEIRNANGLTHSAALSARGGPFKFRYMYIHDNNCAIYNNNPAGIQLTNGTGDCIIEYNVFSTNGYIGIENHENSSNLDIYSDYKYTEYQATLNNASGYSITRHNNNIRYNIFDGGTGTYKTPIGIKHKAQQYMMNNAIGSETPYTDIHGWADQGDKVHHNIFLNHTYASIYDQGDFSQYHNNICVAGPNMYNSNIYVNFVSNVWDINSHQVVYNNTIIGGGRAGVSFQSNSSSSGLMATLQSSVWAMNNIIDGPTDGDNCQDLSFFRDYQDHSYDADNLAHAWNNVFYRPLNTSVARLLKTNYNITDFNAFSWASSNVSYNYDSNDLLYAGTTGAEAYKLNPSYSNYSTVSTGGVGGVHPYLPDVTIPSYIGAVDPNNNSWVDGIMALNVEYMTTAVGDPIWIIPVEPNTKPTVNVLSPQSTQLSIMTLVIDAIPIDGQSINSVLWYNTTTDESGSLEFVSGNTYSGQVPIVIGLNSIVITTTQSDFEQTITNTNIIREITVPIQNVPIHNVVTNNVIIK